MRVLEWGLAASVKMGIRLSFSRCHTCRSGLLYTANVVFLHPHAW